MFLLGILSGNKFLTIIQRSVLGTLIFLVIIIGVFVIFKKTLFSFQSDNLGGGGKNIDDTIDSSHVDIEIEGENPYSGSDSNIHVAKKPMHFDKDEDNENDNFLDDSFVEEVEEDTLGDMSSLGKTEKDNIIVEVMNDTDTDMKNGSGISNSADKVIPPADQVNSAASAGSGKPAEVEIGQLDTLPDFFGENKDISELDSASELFGNDQSGEGGIESISISAKANEKLNHLGINASGEEMAKAIKTVLIRDEKK
jgi:hypothetical protein